MKRKLHNNSIFSRIHTTISAFIILLSISNVSAQLFVAEHGQLQVEGNQIVDQSGEVIQLRGMSLYWSQWNSDSLQKKNKFYTSGTVKWLRDDWKCTVVRAAMGVEDTLGYAVDSLQETQVTTVADAAIEHGIYVIIDYHSHLAHENPALAKKFFAKMAKRYAGKPNVIYETYNEPRTDDWSAVKAYHEEVIEVIRQYDKENIIIAGTPFYCQHIDKAANNPLSDSNVAYAVHYYAAKHDFRTQTKSAMDKGIAVFISEYGTVDYNGQGDPSVKGSQDWWTFLDENNIGNCNWSLHDLLEGASALKLGASPDGGWGEDELTASGKLVRDYLSGRAEVDPVTDVENNVITNSISISPNPFNTSFHVEEIGSFTYKLVNSLGKELLAGKGENKAEIIVEVFPGVYTIILESAKGMKISKVIKE